MAGFPMLSWNQLTQFSELLARCYDKHLSVVEGLNTVQTELDDNGLKAVVRRITQLIDAGHDIDKVFARFMDQFPPFYLRVINLAVAANRFPKIFSGLAAWCRGMEKRERFWERVSLHPRIAIWITAALVISMWLWTSRAVLSVSNIVKMIFPLVLLAFIISWIYSVLHSKERTPKQEYVLLKIPYLRNAYRTMLTAEVAEKINALLPMELPPVELLRVVREFTPNQIIRSEVTDVVRAVENGTNPGVALERTVNISRELGTVLRDFEHSHTFRQQLSEYQENQSFEAQLQIRSTLGAVRAFSYGPAAMVIILAGSLFFV